MACREEMDKLLTLADDRMYENKRLLYDTEYRDMARNELLTT